MHDKNIRNMQVSVGVTDGGISVHLEDGMSTLIGSDCPCYSLRSLIKKCHACFLHPIEADLGRYRWYFNNAFANRTIEIISKTENKI